MSEVLVESDEDTLDMFGDITFKLDRLDAAAGVLPGLCSAPIFRTSNMRILIWGRENIIMRACPGTDFDNSGILVWQQHRLLYPKYSLTVAIQHELPFLRLEVMISHATLQSLGAQS